MSRAVPAARPRVSPLPAGNLREREALLGLLDCASDLIQSSAPDGRLLFANRAWREALGYDENEVADLSACDVIHADGLDAWELIVEQAMAGLPLARVHSVLVTRDGIPIPVTGNVSCRFGAGDTVSVQAAFRVTAGRPQGGKEAEESERYVFRCMEALPLGVFVVDAEGTPFYANPAAREMLGKGIDPTAGPDGLAQVYKACVAGTNDEYALSRMPIIRALDSEVSMIEDMEIRRPDMTLPLQVWGAPVLDDDGQVAYAMALFADNSERRRVEKELRETSIALESATEGISRVDSRGRYTSVNRAYASMFGYEPAEMAGMEWLAAIHPDDRQRLEAARREMLQTGRAEIEVRATRRSGHHFEVRAALVSARDERGNFAGHYCLAQDITERKRAEEALRASEAQLAGVIGSAMDAIITIDTRQRITLFNAAAEKVFRCPASEAIGQPIERFIPEDLREAHRSSVRAFHQSGVTKRRMGKLDATPVLGLRADGEQFPVEASLSRTDAGGQMLSTVIIRDITEHSRAEEALARRAAELARSNAELEHFAYVASHDLKEPLRMVTSYLQLLQRRYQGRLDTDADEFIGYAVDGAIRMRSLIEGLLAYSRVGTRGGPFAPTDCEAVFERVLADLQATIRENGAIVTRDPLPTIMADAVQLEQLLQNLVGNAIKFRSEKTPEVHVRANPRANGGWLFSVSDNGIGIEAGSGDRIFVIFQRLHSRTEYPGTGIGLAICKKIVERHGGHIWVESQPGTGSTFYFTLPERQGSSH